MSRKCQNIAPLFILSLGVLLLSSCIADEYPSTEMRPSADTTDDMSGIITVFFPVSTGSYASSTRATEYDSGTDFENTIDTYRIFLYDTDNYYIGELGDCAMVERDGGDYYFCGTFDSATLEQYEDIKIVFCANWEDLADTFSPDAGSTIEDLCSSKSDYSSYLYFSANSDNNFNFEDAGAYLPFYGVREYDKFLSKAKNSSIELSEKISLLRAVAKIEVYFDDEMASAIDNVHIRGYYSKGLCAPLGVYHQDDYKEGYTATINDDKSYRISFSSEHPIYEIDGGWSAYLPEHDNFTTRYSAILFEYKGESYTLYYANYTNGTTTAYSDDEPADKPDRVNIMRNVLYRFHVSVRPSYPREISVEMTTMPWVVEDIGITVE